MERAEIKVSPRKLIEQNLYKDKELDTTLN
jgi:hypothetical protein